MGQAPFDRNGEVADLNIGGPPDNGQFARGEKFVFRNGGNRKGANAGLAERRHQGGVIEYADNPGPDALSF